MRILVDSFADQGLTNAQMTNGREIIRRLDPDRFHVSVFCAGDPDPAIERRPNTRLVFLPRRRRTVRILREFVLGSHDILFYVKSAPASNLYMALRKKWNDRRITVGTIESQSDLRNEPTITSEAVRLWEKTVLRCDYLFSNSQSTQASLRREYDLPSEIVPTGVDTAFSRRCGIVPRTRGPECCLQAPCVRSNNRNLCWTQRSAFPSRLHHRGRRPDDG